MPRALATFTWTLAVPFFVSWTFLGTWLLLCYYWIFVHVALSVWACRLRARVQRTEANLRDIEDDETLRRWGQVSRSSASRPLVEVARGGESLSSAAIRALPCETAAVPETVLGKCECPICLSEIEAGDSIRCLPTSGSYAVRIARCASRRWRRRLRERSPPFFFGSE